MTILRNVYVTLCFLVLGTAVVGAQDAPRAERMPDDIPAARSSGGQAALRPSAAGASGNSAVDDVAGALATIRAFHADLAAGRRAEAIDHMSSDARIFESGHAESRGDYLAHHLDADIAFAREVVRTIDTTASECHETLCVVMQRTRMRGTYRDKPIDLRGTETTVLRKTGNRWLIAHAHWSTRKPD